MLLALFECGDAPARPLQDRLQLLQAQLTLALGVPSVKDGVGGRVLHVELHPLERRTEFALVD
eukprot:16617-Prymnesium_polylepis.2